MLKINLLLVLLLFHTVSGKHYILYDDPIDVVIVCHKIDAGILPHCIQGAKENIQNIRRIIVISDEQFTDDAEWCDEKLFPFSKNDLFEFLAKKYRDCKRLKNSGSRVGWYFQQLLKLYAPFVVPGISSNVLILDADTIFLRPVSFLNEKNGGLYCTGTEYHKPYFAHINILLGLDRVFFRRSGIVHHMLFQRSILSDMLSTIEKKHEMEAWKAFCFFVDPKHLHRSGASEYELYFNFAFTMTDQVSLRPLKWKNASHWENQECDFVSCHYWRRSN